MEHKDPIDEIVLEDCPVCQGAGLLEEENGWCFYVSCMDCGSQTASVDYRKPEQRLEAARQAAWLWNSGKTIYTGCSD